MGRKDPFIKFFPSDFLGGTSGLSPAERGVYITLLCLIWDGNGPIQLDDGRLARRCGMPKASFKKALKALMDEGKIIRAPGGLTNKRAHDVLEDQNQRSATAKANAASRWTAQTEKTQQNQRPDDATAMQAQYSGNATALHGEHAASAGGKSSFCEKNDTITKQQKNTEQTEKYNKIKVRTMQRQCQKDATAMLVQSPDR